ncbi:MAG: hypothetical protein KFF73_17675, partial [Cyclobacteriaceae bacterium]|nr:hypothetical protein [Cyclobacteriaceae bacterium]
MNSVRYIAVTSVFMLILILNGNLVYGQPFKVYGVSDLVRVFEDGHNLSARNGSLDLFGIRNEIISGQLVVQAEKNLMGLGAEITDLVDRDTGNNIPAEIIEWNFVGGIPLSENAPNQPLDAVVREAPALFPDYLKTERNMELSKGRYQAIWFTIPIPESIPPGRYSGNVKIVAKEGERSLPINITVYPFLLP